MRFFKLSYYFCSRGKLPSLNLLFNQPCGHLNFNLTSSTRLTLQVRPMLNINLTINHYTYIYGFPVPCTIRSVLTIVQGSAHHGVTVDAICPGSPPMSFMLLYNVVLLTFYVQYLNLLMTASISYQVYDKTNLKSIFSYRLPKSIDGVKRKTAHMRSIPRQTFGPYDDYRNIFLDTVIKAPVGKHIVLQLFVSNKCISETSSVKLFDGTTVVDEVYLCKNHTLSYNVVTDEVKGGTALRAVMELQGSFFMRAIYMTEFAEYFHRRTNFVIAFKSVKMNQTYVRLNETQQQYILHVDTSKESVYYKQWNIVATSFVMLNMIKLHTLTGSWENCLYGGFMFTEGSKIKRGPICSKGLGIPLVNEHITTWYTGHQDMVFTVFAYKGSFEMNFTIAFQMSTCEGITNVCDVGYK